MWADLVFELRSYLDNWLAGMKVDDIAALEELLVTEQIKKRAPSELVDHFLDSMMAFLLKQTKEVLLEVAIDLGVDWTILRR
ncbi:hypothetical protein TNCV_4775181 [Trichonephila clavipes]|nr:hypothetical protein TNCV_4775181 [Trichonephila clavipes]